MADPDIQWDTAPNIAWDTQPLAQLDPDREAAVRHLGGVLDSGSGGGVLEGAANLGTGLAASLVGGVAGLGALGTKALGLTSTDPGEVVNQVSNALTYQPRTKQGEEAATTLQSPFRWLAEQGRDVGERIQEAKPVDLDKVPDELKAPAWLYNKVAGSIAAATAAETAIQSLPMIAGIKAGEGLLLPRDVIKPEEVDAWLKAHPESEPAKALPAPEAKPVEPEPPLSAVDRSAKIKDMLDQHKEGMLTPDEHANLVDLMVADRNQAYVGMTDTPMEGVQKLAARPAGITPSRAFIDIDELKKANDEEGHAVGDSLIKTVGESLAERFPGNTFHRSGDEFIVHGDPDDLRQGLLDVRDQLKDQPLTAVAADGTPIASSRGIKFSFGIGDDDATAETDQSRDKGERAAQGLRAERAADIPGSEATRGSSSLDRRPETPADSGSAVSTDVAGLDRSSSASPRLPGELDTQLDPVAATYARSIVQNPAVSGEITQWLDRNKSSPDRVNAALHQTALEHQALEPQLHEEAKQQRPVVQENAGRQLDGAQGERTLPDEGSQAGAPARQPLANANAQTDVAQAVGTPADQGLSRPGQGIGIPERQQALASAGGSAGSSGAAGGTSLTGTARQGGFNPAAQHGFVGQPPTPPVATPTAPPPKTPGQAAGLVRLSDPKAVKEAGRGVAREAWAQRDIATARSDQGLDYFRRAYDARPRDVITDPQKALQPIIDFQKGGLPAVTDPTTANFLREAQRMIGERTQKIQDIGKREGKPLLQTLRQNYFPQEWERDPKALDWASNYYRKSPMQGDRSFLKQRVFDDLEEGIKAGFKPVSNNPVDLVMSKLWQMDKFIATHEMMGKMQDMGLMRDHPMDKQVPPDWGRINDYTFTGKIVPKSVADSINNVLDPGLNKYGAWRAMRYAQNMILSARMGFSFFHAGFTTFDTLVAHMADGLDRLARGDIHGAIKSMAKTAVSPVMSPIEGRRFVQQVLGLKPGDHHTSAILESLVSGGMRVKMDPTDYNNAYAQFGRALRQRDLGAMGKTAVPALLEASTRYVMNSLVPYQKMAARVLMMKNELERMAQFTNTSPKDYAGTINAMNPVVLREVAGRVNQLVDDRLGQVAYDNRFWNSTAKHLAQFLIQAPGWNVGTANVVLKPITDLGRLVKPERYSGPVGGAGQAPEATRARLSPRITYLAAALGVTAIYGAVRQYLATGESPQSRLDLVMPRTGGNNPDGSPIRESLPSYVKDMAELKAHPLTTMMHKINPTLSMMNELFIQNKDYFGNMIRNPEDSAATQAEQVGKYLAHENLPYSIQNSENARNAGKSTAAQLLPLVGVTQAPSSVTRSPFQEKVAESLGTSTYSRTPEQAAQAQKKYVAENQIRMGQKPDLSGFDTKTQEKIKKDTSTPMMESRFKRLVGQNRQAALAAWEEATPDEREKYHLQRAMFHSREGEGDETKYGKGWHNYLQTLDPSERGPVLQKLKQAYDWSKGAP